MNYLIWIQLLFLVAHTLANEQIQLRGSGATFPSEVYSTFGPAFESYRQDYVDIDFTYDLENSIGGKKVMFLEYPTVSFGGSEVDMSTFEKNLNPEVTVVPVLAGGLAMAYNLPGVYDLVLSREAIVGIYNGTITKWNDPLIAIDNPDYFFPWEDILPVARADVSGSTEIFTRTLSTISPEWNQTYGTFYEGLNEFFGGNIKPVHWNDSVITYYGRTNRGMTGLIFSYRFSLGYVAMGEALSVNWTYARIINKAGNIVDVDTVSTDKVMQDVFLGETPMPLVADLVDSSLPDAYPFLGLSYILIKTVDMPDCVEAREFYFFVDWLLRDSTASYLASELVYNVVIPEMADFILENIMAGITCNGTTNVKKLVQEQKEHEKWLKNRPLRIGLGAGITCGLAMLIGFIAYIVFQHIRLRKSLRAGEWKIPANDVDIKWDRDKGWTLDPTSRFSDFGSCITGVQSMVSEGAFSQLWSLLIVKYGKWNGRLISLRRFPKPHFQITKEPAKLVIMTMKTKVIHANVLRFHGVCELDSELFLVSDHAEKGSLTDVIQNCGYKLDDNFKYALAMDVANGLDFLHSNGIIHGNLTSDCCLLDGRWNVKVTHWELLKIYCEEQERKLSRVQPVFAQEVHDDTMEARLNMWAAPEILRSLVHEPNKKTDIYSFSILLVEIFTREDPYSEYSDKMEPKEIVDAIIREGLRPDLREIDNKKIKPIIKSAWNEDPSKRPTLSNLNRDLRKGRTSRKSVIESMMDTLEEYVVNLEEKVQERTSELASVNKSLESLLHQILPPSVAKSLSKGETVEPEQFSSATIFFSDIVGFTNLCAASTPIEVVNFLNDLYTMFDSVIDKLDVYKVETIGDAYMCISGVPLRNGIKHAGNIATMALRLFDAVKSFKISHKPDEKLQLRAGVHTGPVVAGVVGIKMPRYCLFGDTVNTSSRMESTSIAMHIQVSETTHKLLTEIGGYELEPRGKVVMKGKGEMSTYFLKGHKEKSIPATQFPTLPARSVTRTPSNPAFNLPPAHFATPDGSPSKSRLQQRRVSIAFESPTIFGGD